MRQYFSGGWAGDPVDKFVRRGRTGEEIRAFDLIAKLAHLRRSHVALHSGKTMQFVPMEGLYVFFRYTDEQTVMVVANTSKNPQSAPTSKFDEMLHGRTAVRNLLTEQTEALDDTLRIGPMDIRILELLRR